MPAAVMAHQNRHIIGQAGVGKTTLVAQLLAQDTHTGICVFDTKGDLDIPHDVLFDPTVTRWNPLAEPINPNLAPNFFAETVKDAYGYDDLTTPVMSMYLSFLAAALIENRFNLTDAPRFLTDQKFRTKCGFKSDLVRHFWDTFDTLSPRDQRHEVASTLNKFLTLLLDGRVDRLFDHNAPSFSLGDMNDKVLLVRLPVASYGKQTTSLLASLVLAYLVKLVPDDYSIYLEDVDLFAKGTVLSVLNTGGKQVTLSHQYIEQLHPTLFAAVLGNCAERFVFRVSKQDAEILSRDLPPMSPKTSLDRLPDFSYRKLPFEKYDTDQITFPLEK
ncbi:hypothetical protein [uncultured Roseobacter sp.]|uniref:hypothetical protein n=1 Tax=uncultured Roseobacter sp. TaxID=114847 RepID=UPI0026066330|nr:hypothetical protein [uncultured Roseobacter sp.]